jgi:protein TonB
VNPARATGFFKQLCHHTLVAAGALTLTFAFFIILPLIQAITAPPAADLTLLSVDAANIPPPPPPEEEKPEEEPEPEEKPPELEEDSQPLDLAQLELALNPGVGSGLVSGDLAVRLNTDGGSGGDGDLADLLSVSDLDQKPRVIYQPSPVLDAKVRAKAPGKVYVIFIVDERGRVENPIVQSSSDPIFEAPALAAVKQWKFEPAKRNGVVVRFRMRAPITFPKSG